MPTHVMSKKAFIILLEKQVKDDEVILYSNEVSQMTCSKKNESKTTHILYAANAFAEPHTVGDLFSENIAVGGMLILNKNELSKNALEILKSEE